MLVTVEGTFSDGQVKLNEIPAGVDGAKVIVTFLVEEKAPDGALSTKSFPSISGLELLESQVVGMWADRGDLPDSPDFAHQLREKAQRR